MSRKFPDSVFQQKINDLAFSKAFMKVAEREGYVKLIDLARTPVPILGEHSGFSMKLLMEYSRFMEDRDLGHYIDDPY